MKVDISIGELVDKVSILCIKLMKMSDAAKLENIRKEYGILKGPMEGTGITEESEEFKRLKVVNLRLWDIEDKIRFKESKKEFDEDFIQLARSVYRNNDERAEIKREINLKFGSDLIEEKEYVDYKEP